MKYYNEFDDPHTGEFLSVERNVMNPLNGLSFVSIAYYQNVDGTKYAIVF